MEQKNEVMEALQTLVFNNDEFGSVRTLVLNNEAWFVGKDVAECLGYAKPRNAISSHVDDEDKKDAPIQGALGGTQKMKIINESGMYSLIFGSKLPSAKTFKHWVTSEVLPQIRKTGGYIPVKQEDDDLTIMAKALQIMKNTMDEKDELISVQNQKIQEKDQTIKEQEPLVSFANTVSATPTMVDMKTMAKLLNQENEGLNFGRNKLFAWLREHNYLMKDNTPYQRYVKLGIFKVSEEEIDTMNGKKMCTKTYVTGKGQLYLDKKIKEYYRNLEETA